VPFLMILIVGMANTENTISLQQLGAHVRNLRTKKSMTQVELASKCGLDRNYIGMLERGERNPSYLTLVKIAKGLGLSMSNLLNL